MYILTYTSQVQEDIDALKRAGEIQALKKLKILLEELSLHPTTGAGKPEQLKYERAGQWSRRITDKHRLVYCIEEMTVTVTIIQAYGHYNDK